MPILTELTIVEAARLISQGDLSPVMLTQAYLDRIERLEPQLGSFITLTAQAALEQAQAVEDELRRGHTRGPLHGIPLALKDLFETAGIRTTAGSKILSGYTPVRDATVVQKLKAAGAILLGKLNLYEWALKPNNDNPFFGSCWNPWDLERDPGGSSGGAGAALAASLCLGALGTDTGGSVRIPAALCGVVGLKPTYGRISTHGVLPLSWHLDHVGPMARHVADVALLLQLLAGYDPADPWSVDRPTGSYYPLDSDIRRMRIALAQDDSIGQADEEVLAAVTQAAEILQQLGAAVTPLALPQLQTARQMNGIILISDAAQIHRDRLQQQPEEFSPQVLESLQYGAMLPATEYAQARYIQAHLRREFETLFHQYDLLLTPTTPTVAPRRGEPEAAAPALTSFTAPFNLIGFPALSIPCGFDRAGLPIGLQLVARPWAEPDLLQTAYAYEQATHWTRRKPAL